MAPGAEPDERAPLLSPETNGAAPEYGSTPAPDPAATSDAEGGDATAAKVPRNLLAVLVPMGLGIFFASMDQTIVVSSYAAIGSELQQLQYTSWISTAYMMTLTSFQPLYGKLSDIFGRKSCLLFAYTIFALGCFCCSISQTMLQLILARGLTGIGGGGMSTVVSIIMSDMVPLRERGTWQGIMNIIYASGSAIGAPLGGFLVDSIGWRWGFFMQVPALVLAFISVSFALHLPESDTSDLKSKLKRVDFPGAFALVLTVFFLLFGLDRGGNIAWHDPTTIASLSVFAVLFVLFLVIEFRWAKEPFAPKRIVAHPALAGAYLVNFFALMAGFNMIFHMSFFYQAVLRKTPSEVGFWLVPGVFAGVFGSLAGGLIIQVTGRYYWATVAAYVGFLVAIFALTLQTGVVILSGVGVVIAGTFASIGNGLGITTTLIALISNAGPADQAMATAGSYLFRSLGSVIGLSVASTLLQNSLRSTLHKTLPAGIDIEEIIRRVRESLAYIDELEPATAAVVRMAYERGLQVTFWFSCAAAACALVAAVFVREAPMARRG
ncbi:unnamed protein product [Mycena citricolor]|uniref:Major facilitator superfamily (MFS) profile domain-containing protein n=1 Tax=Mycena citricolor TaxID=2018698 RepID=A0AAD2HP52_9AGAR|nr:unnamed protein product [Mycena citricolor]